MDRATQQLNEAFSGILMRFEIERREQLYEQIAADPVKHKTTLQWPKGSNGPSIIFYEGGVSRGVRRRFCYTANRNAAGYFLSFVEVYHLKKRMGERKEFRASKTRRLMDARAKRMRDAWANRKR